MVSRDFPTKLMGRPFLGKGLEHTAWYEPFTIAELCGRHGFALKTWHGLRPDPVPGGLGRFLFEAFAKIIRRGWAFPLSPLTGCRSILYECEKRA